MKIGIIEQAPQLNLRCPCCERTLKKKDFWWTKEPKPRRRKDGRSSYCKDCTRRHKREEYRRNRKTPDGLRYDPYYGRAIVKQGSTRRIYWTEDMLKTLRNRYPVTPNPELCVTLAVSERTLIRKANELGIKKDAEYLKRRTERGVKAMQFMNRFVRNEGMFKPGQHANPAGEFKPGHNQNPMGIPRG